MSAATSFGVRDVNRVAGSFHLDLMALGAFRVHAFQVRVNRLVRFRDQVPAWLLFPSRVGDRRGEHRGSRRHLRVGEKVDVRMRHVSREIFREVGRIKKHEPVCRFNSDSEIKSIRVLRFTAAENLGPTLAADPGVSSPWRFLSTVPGCFTSVYGLA
jgi:hypothetical protein